MSHSIPLRGVIEGFYGQPWSHAARLHAIEFLAERGMNAYVYAPKDDPKHRVRWREAYDSNETTRFRDLAAACARVQTTLGFAISPGLDIEYSNAGDRDALASKLLPLLDAGVTWFVLALDDIPPRPGLAKEQADLTGWLRDRLGADPALRLTLVPTEYVGTRPSPYLTELSAGLPSDVDVMWTGPTVCSPVINARDATHWRDALGGRPLLLWDNYPVNDTVMERELHLGPYRGRDPALVGIVDGVLCNPMLQPRASLVALATAAEFLGDPTGYDESAAWERAIDEVGGANAGPLRALARACADGPLATADELPSAALVATLKDAVSTPAWAAPLVALRAELAPLAGGPDEWVEDALRAEVAPWAEQAEREVAAAIAALRLIQQVRPIAVRDDDGAGRAAPPDAESAMLQCFAVLFSWMAARESSREVVLGPRFALHPAVVQMSDGRQGVDIGLALREDRSVVDRICRLALSEYAQWSQDPSPTLRVTADDDDVAVDAAGAFRASPDVAVTVHSHSHSTTVRSGEAPPFRDLRLR